MRRYGGKKYRSKRYKRRGIRRGNKKTVLVNNSLAPFPAQLITKMKYSQTFTISSALGAKQEFNLNSVWDPDRTGIGHQPYGFDTLSTVYNRYKVMSCSYSINAYPSEGTAPIRVCALPANDAITNTTLSDACEDPRAKWMIQVPGAPAKALKGRVYLPNIMGRTLRQYDGDETRFAALAGASPTELAILNIYAQGLNDTGTSVLGTITMTYTVKWLDPIILAQS